jgi:large subunit ribosomal protein L17
MNDEKIQREAAMAVGETSGQTAAAGPRRVVSSSRPGADAAGAEAQPLVLEADPELERLLSDEASIGGPTPVAAVAEPTKHDGPHGRGSHAPIDDPEAQPDGFPIKGNANSMLYHTPGSAFYDRTVAEVWFATEEAATAAGFSKPASQRAADEAAEAADTEGEDA